MNNLILMIIYATILLARDGKLKILADDVIQQELQIKGVAISTIECQNVDENSKIAIVDGKLCIVTDEQAYLYDGICGELVDIIDGINTVYSREVFFIALDTKGHIVSPKLDKREYGKYPLTTAGCYYNAEEMIDALTDKKIQFMSNFLEEYCIVYLEDGTLELFVNGNEKVISDNLDVTKISGQFILTKDGTVYMISHPDNLTAVFLKQLSEEEFVDISACENAERCIGIKKDGTAVLWSDVKLDFNFSSEKYKKACMGFNYAVLVCEDGSLEYYSSNKEREKQISFYLKRIDKNVIDIAVAYDYIAILLQDGEIVYITE